MPHHAFNLSCYWLTVVAMVWQLGAGASAAPAVKTTVNEPKYTMRNWQMEDGLPRNTITAISQTPNGYLWLGTPFGVIRFDGITFTRMEGDFHPGFTRARTRVLYTDMQERLWIGTGTAGIIRQTGDAFTLINSQNGLPHPTVSSICEDLDGTIWVGCQDGSLSWVDEENAVHAVPAFRGEQVAGQIQLARDIWGMLWFAQRDAYGQLIEGVATNIVVITNSSIVLCPSRDGGMWVSAGELLHKLPPPESDKPIETVPCPVNPNQTPALCEDHRGTLWVGSPRDGVYRLAGQEFIQELNTSHRILSIFEDAESNIWVGTEGGGLIRLRPRVFHTLTTREGLPQPMLRSVCEGVNGDIWLSGQGPMLMKWNPESGLASAPGFTNIGTTCVLPMPEGGIWVGTVGWGLFATQEDDQSRVGPRNPFRNRQIRAMHQDAQGQVWLGCLPDGLARLAGGRMDLPQVYFDQGLPADAIWSIADDPNGNLWLGTIRGELWRYDGTNFTSFGETNGLPGASIGALHFTREGDLWIGTMGGGLGRSRNGQFVFADVSHGLADDVISGIVEDGLGWFWLSSDRGIIRVRKRDLDEFADGRRDQFDSIHYGNDEGLGNVECIGGYQPSAWRTRSGDIWFATSKGAVWLNPMTLSTNSRPPRLVLEQVVLDDATVTNGSDLKFRYGYRKLDFEYTAPSFIAPDRIRFRHRLVGLDAGWIEAGTTRRASYPRLAPGRYVFQFTACNFDSEWNEQIVSLPFEVTPAYWQTVWFRALGLLVFGGLVAGGVRYRYVQKMRRKLRKLEEARAVEQERMRIARDIHDDLGARLTQMAFLSEMVAAEVNQQGKAHDRLVKLADSSREAIRSLDEIVWAVNPQKDSLPDFVDYISQHANQFFHASGTRCRQSLPMIIPDVSLPTNLRHHLFLACKEALNNVSKHAKASDVWLRLEIAGDDLEMTIEDNGVGFSPAILSNGRNGLTNMNSRLAGIGGRCEVESLAGQGTRVRFLVRLKPATRQNTGPAKRTARATP